MNGHELWTVAHGMVFGAIFLLGFTGTLYGVYIMRPEWLTTEGTDSNVRRIRAFLWIMAIVVWLAVFSGAWIVYPWYRAAPPEGTADLTMFPRSFLLANPSLAFWHEFGMEWKEHVAFIAPFAATAVAYAVHYFGAGLSTRPEVRRWIVAFFVVAFVAAAAAGLLGAFITKAAPVR